MPLKCPACTKSVRQQLTEAGDDTPLVGRIYRCTVCRLELVLSDDHTQMVVAPLPELTRKKKSA